MLTHGGSDRITGYELCDDAQPRAESRSGDAYTMAEYTKMFDSAGFVSSEAHTLDKPPGTLIVGRKA